MSESPDRISISLNRDGDVDDASAVLSSILDVLAGSFLPAPGTFEPIGRNEKAIAGFRDPAVLAALGGKNKGVRLKGKGLHVELLRLRSGIAVLILFGPGPTPDAIRDLFKRLVVVMEPSYGRVHLDRHSRQLHEAYYAEHRRTFYASGLYWLNYFGPEELALQGGEAVSRNPLARAERMGSGVLLEVGSDPLEAATPEGVTRLVAATEALPPAPAT